MGKTWTLSRQMSFVMSLCPWPYVASRGWQAWVLVRGQGQWLAAGLSCYQLSSFWSGFAVIVFWVAFEVAFQSLWKKQKTFLVIELSICNLWRSWRRCIIHLLLLVWSSRFSVMCALCFRMWWNWSCFPHYSFLRIVLDVEFCLVKCLSVCSVDFGVTVSQHLVDYIWIWAKFCISQVLHCR